MRSSVRVPRPAQADRPPLGRSGLPREGSAENHQTSTARTRATPTSRGLGLPSVALMATAAFAAAQASNACTAGGSGAGSSMLRCGQPLVAVEIFVSRCKGSRTELPRSEREGWAHGSVVFGDDGGDERGDALGKPQLRRGAALQVREEGPDAAERNHELRRGVLRQVCQVAELLGDGVLERVHGSVEVSGELRASAGRTRTTCVMQPCAVRLARASV